MSGTPLHTTRTPITGTARRPLELDRLLPADMFDLDGELKRLAALGVQRRAGGDDDRVKHFFTSRFTRPVPPSQRVKGA